MLVGDIEECRVADPIHQLGCELVITREDEPRTEEGGLEPGVTDDRALFRLDQDPGMTERGCPHRWSGNRRVGELLATTGDVLGPLLAVPVPQFESTRWVGVPSRGCPG